MNTLDVRPVTISSQDLDAKDAEDFAKIRRGRKTLNSVSKLFKNVVA